MSDLISRQAAIDVAQKTIENPRVLDRVMLKLYELPSAQPEQTCGYWDSESKFCALYRPASQPEQKKGKWIDGHCSECGCDVPAYIIDWKWQKDMDANYCPNCGAKMEVEE